MSLFAGSTRKIDTMNPTLYEPLGQTLAPLFDALPFNQAMSRLVVVGPGGEHAGLVEQLIDAARLGDRPELCTGLWLYVDELDRSHTVSQQLDTQTGSFWHAIMHRREGDFSNSKYWYRRAGKHPAMAGIDTPGGSATAGTTSGHYDPYAFVDSVERAHTKGDNARPELVALQRREWKKLFEWCAEHH